MTATGLFYDLFSPIPAPVANQQKDAMDHVAEYVGTTSGAWDLFRIGNQVFSALHMYLDSSHHLSGLVGKVKEVFDSAGLALSIPQFFSDANSLRRSITQLSSVQDLPYSDPQRTRKIAQAAKKSFLDSVGLTFTMAQIAIFTENVKIFAMEAAHLKLLNGVYDATGAIGDGADLLSEYGKLKHYQSLSPAQDSKLEEKATLAWMNIAKDVASVALAAISITAALYGVAISSIFALSVVTLALSAFWLTMKITTYFYNKVMVEAPMTPVRASI